MSSFGQYLDEEEGRRPVILSIESNPRFRDGTVEWLRAEGYEVISRVTAREGIATLKQMIEKGRPPILVITDLNRRETINGWDVFDAVNDANETGTRIGKILFADEVSRQEIFDHGGFEIALPKKDSDKADVLEAVANAIKDIRARSKPEIQRQAEDLEDFLEGTQGRPIAIVVDPFAITRERTARYLRNAGFSVSSVSNVEMGNYQLRKLSRLETPATVLITTPCTNDRMLHSHLNGINLLHTWNVLNQKQGRQTAAVLYHEKPVHLDEKLKEVVMLADKDADEQGLLNAVADAITAVGGDTALADNLRTRAAGMEGSYSRTRNGK